MLRSLEWLSAAVILHTAGNGSNTEVPMCQYNASVILWIMLVINTGERELRSASSHSSSVVSQNTSTQFSDLSISGIYGANASVSDRIACNHPPAPLIFFTNTAVLGA